MASRPALTEAQRYAGRYLVNSRQEMLHGSGESWWTVYSRGARRDAEYQAEAARRRPGTVTGLVLPEWTHGE